MISKLLVLGLISTQVEDHHKIPKLQRLDWKISFKKKTEGIANHFQIFAKKCIRASLVNEEGNH